MEAKLHSKYSAYRLNTVTYGTASAPFLAIQSIFYLSDLFRNQYPVASEIIKKDFYVDDLLTGADSFEVLDKIRSEISTILESGGFPLAKWFSNHPVYLNKNCDEKFINFNDSDSTKTLGLIWVPEEDSFKFKLENNFQNLQATKRNILSVSARLFDPLGLLSPIVTKAKILLQELWLQKLDWDESIPMRLDSTWEEFKKTLLEVGTVSIPRFVCTSPNSICQVHGFADASIRAYGCSLYIRCQNNDGVSVRLLTAKSKVAPLKTKTLPVLELCASFLLAKLWFTVKPLMNIPISSVTFWSDSQITLHWVKLHPSTLQTFVGNRVSYIQEVCNDVIWRHVPSKQNPENIVSRGTHVDELKNSIWFDGPAFLKTEPENWPKTKINLSPEMENLQIRKCVLSVEKVKNMFINLIEKQSSYIKLLRIFCTWYQDYLLSLQERGKWRTAHLNLKVGALVLIHEDNLPPQQWKLGRIVATIKGADERVRVVDIKIGDSVFRRAIHKVAPLPIEDSQFEDMQHN